MHRGYEGRISRRIRAGMEFVLEKGFPPCAEVAGEEIGQDGHEQTVRLLCGCHPGRVPPRRVSQGNRRKSVFTPETPPFMTS